MTLTFVASSETLPALIDSERRARTKQLLAPGDEPRRAFHAALEVHRSLAAAARRAEAWSISLDYAHPGQSRDMYLAHPYRVTTLYLTHETAPGVEGVCTGLVHNVLEVAQTDVATLEAALGPAVASAVRTLTINRSRQSDRAYLATYYAAILAAPRFVPVVKLLDKLDNLFVLCLNGDETTRTRYLKEIEDFVLPLASAVLPGICGLIEALIVNNRRVGHRPLDSFAT